MAVATSSVSSQHNHNESFSGTFSGTNPVRKDKMNYLNDLTNSFQKSNLNKGKKNSNEWLESYSKVISKLNPFYRFSSNSLKNL